MFHRIAEIRTSPDYRLWLRYEDGTAGEIDCQPLIRRGGVYDRIASPDKFRKVTIGGAGRYLEWPGNVDFCADALYEQLKQGIGKNTEAVRSA